MIKVDQLSKFYGRHCAVNNISFDVDQGEIVGFLGPNGAGKSTTIKMLTSFLRPSSGSAAVAGFDVVKQSLKSRARIGYMPENVPLYLDMRVREYLKFRAGLKGLHNAAAREAISQAIERTGIREVRHKIINTLSKGFRQRVGLADALLGNPDLLILDEPTNGLDPNQIRQIRALIEDLAKHHTVLLSTHILSEVEMICNKVIIIDQGKIKAANTPNALIENMRVAGKVSLEIKAPPEQAAAAISQLDKVKKVTHEGQAERGDWEKFSVRVESNTDARQRIAKLVQQQDWPLRQIFRHQPTLEDVFVELTRKD